MSKITPTSHQDLPRAGPERELLRKKGQFWTPQWVADPMVAYVLRPETKTLLDPAIGEGIFFKSAIENMNKQGLSVGLHGIDVDAVALDKAQSQKALKPSIDTRFELRDFINNPPNQKYDSIIANPPYIRHHRIPIPVKLQFRERFVHTPVENLDGRAGFHVYFLVQALSLLNKRGRLCFIVPADTCEGVFAKPLWSWITDKFSLDALISFAPEATPFPGVDTNPIILMLSNRKSKGEFVWCKCNEWGTSNLLKLIKNNLKIRKYKNLEIVKRQIPEALANGLTRPWKERMEARPLKTFAKVMRGVVSGDNNFFFLTSMQVKEEGLPMSYFSRAIGRTRDAQTSILTQANLDELDAAGRPTYLLTLDSTEISKLPASIKFYLNKGEKIGLNNKVVLSQRSPWYRMEKRAVPPILFAYLGRRKTRFIRNYANAIPLTGFLCVYPRKEDLGFIDSLYQALMHEKTLENLFLVGKSYGGGALKVEPRSLENLQIPLNVIQDTGLGRHIPNLKAFTEQLSLQLP